MTYEDYMTPARVNRLINMPCTLEGVHTILEALVTTAFIEDKPQSFYTCDLYMLIGMARERCRLLLEEAS